MKLLSLIEDTKISGMEYATAADTLIKDCSQFIALTGGKLDQFPMYRGISNREIPTLISSHTLQNRSRPRDTPLKIHDAMDEWFSREFGIPYRSESLFVTGDIKFAKQYSNKVVAIIPADGFKYAWSEKVKDLYRNIEFESPLLNVEDEDIDTEVDIFLYGLEYTTKQLDIAIGSGNEIMLHTDLYYMINIAELATLSRYIRGAINDAF